MRLEPPHLLPRSQAFIAIDEPDHDIARVWRRRHRVGRNHELVGMGEFRLPDATAAVATHLAGPAPRRPQGCHLDAIRCTPVRTGDEHRLLSRRRPFAKASSRSVKELKTKPTLRFRAAASAKLQPGLDCP